MNAACYRNVTYDRLWAAGRVKNRAIDGGSTLYSQQLKGVITDIGTDHPTVLVLQLRPLGYYHPGGFSFPRRIPMNKFKDFSPKGHIALRYEGVTYHITVRQMAPDRFKAEWTRPTLKEDFPLMFHTLATQLEAVGSSRLAAQAKLLMKIDPSGVHTVRDRHGNQLA